MWAVRLFSAVIGLHMIWGLEPNPQIPPGSNITQCRDLECPKYDLLFYNQDYEIRRYGPSKWVGTSATRPILGPYDEGGEMYKKLINYISGANDRKEAIPMTLPTVAAVSQFIDEASTNFTMYFYVPEALYEDTPVPTDPTVYVQSDPSFTYYIRAFSGVADTPVYTENFERLIQSIGDPSKYIPDLYISDIYITDNEPSHQRNEALLVAYS